METIDQISNKLFGSVGFKLTLIIALTLLLLIPSFMIRQLILEREQRRDETIGEVTSVWGKAQTICGPVLTIPYTIQENTGSGEFQHVGYNAHLLPEALKIEGKVEPEVRYRGIYKVVTYRTVLHFTGKFAMEDVRKIPGANITEDPAGKAWIEIGIPEMRGINKDIRVVWNDSNYTAVPGIPGGEISSSGVHIEVPVSPEASGAFSFDLDLNGSHSLNFIPLGKETNIMLQSAWNTPSFSGAFLPDNRNITDSGFSADWNILQLNRNYPQYWINDKYNVDASAFGVDLITPVDTYQKSERSVKYAVLFIGLTFLVFFFSEMLTKIRIHPVNYLLVGVALCIFYSLLTALAEHMAFVYAYLIGSITIVSMITIFAHSLYKKWKVTGTVLAVLVALYIFLFVILQLMDYSLLLGNIGLVIILGIVMIFSRKIDWYSTIRSNGNK